MPKAEWDSLRRPREVSKSPRGAPATAELLADAIEKIPAALAGLRDRALVLIGFAAALRRSELVRLRFA